MTTRTRIFGRPDYDAAARLTSSKATSWELTDGSHRVTVLADSLGLAMFDGNRIVAEIQEQDHEAAPYWRRALPAAAKAALRYADSGWVCPGKALVSAISEQGLASEETLRQRLIVYVLAAA